MVTDQTGAMVSKATVTITNDATNISVTAHSDDRGLYILTGLRPAVYTIKADGAGLRAVEQKNVVPQVDQQTTINFELRPLEVITTPRNSAGRNVQCLQGFAFPDVGSRDGALGTVTSTTNNLRRMQFGARFQF